MVIAFPIGYLFARNWLNSFAYRIDLSPWYFITAGVITLFIAWLTVSTQAIRAANINPVQCLRDE